MTATGAGYSFGCVPICPFPLDLPQSTSLAGQPHAARRDRFPAMFQCVPQVQSSAEAPRIGQFLDGPRSPTVRTEMANLSDPILQSQRPPTSRLSAPAVLLPSRIL